MNKVIIHLITALQLCIKHDHNYADIFISYFIILFLERAFFISFAQQFILILLIT